MLRERTTIPRTIPKFLTIRYPESSTPVVTIPASTLGILNLLFEPKQALTGAILAV